MKILVTGGAGFIGSHLVEFHLKQGDEVFVLDNLSTGSEKNIAAFQKDTHFHFVNADLLNWQGLAKQLSWADRIYHMAAMVGMYYLLAHPVETLRSNIMCCERLLRLMDETQSKARLLIASTSEIYGPTHKSPLNEDMPLLFKSTSHSKWGYAASKFTEEMFALAYARSRGTKLSIIRLFNTIGPRQTSHYGMVVPRFIKQACSNEPITVYGSGEQTRSFCDVRDTVKALDLIANKAEALGEIINVGQDQEISMNELAVLVKKLSKSNSIIQHIDYKKAYGEDYEDILHRRPDLKKFYRLTGYTFQWNLEKTLSDLIQQK